MDTFAFNPFDLSRDELLFLRSRTLEDKESATQPRSPAFSRRLIRKLNLKLQSPSLSKIE